jgi:hypothetical protein
MDVHDQTESVFTIHRNPQIKAKAVESPLLDAAVQAEAGFGVRPPADPTNATDRPATAIKAAPEWEQGRGSCSGTAPAAITRVLTPARFYDGKLIASLLSGLAHYVRNGLVAQRQSARLISVRSEVQIPHGPP